MIREERDAKKGLQNTRKPSKQATQGGHGRRRITGKHRGRESRRIEKGVEGGGDALFQSECKGRRKRGGWERAGGLVGRACAVVTPDSRRGSVSAWLALVFCRFSRSRHFRSPCEGAPPPDSSWQHRNGTQQHRHNSNGHKDTKKKRIQITRATITITPTTITITASSTTSTTTHHDTEDTNTDRASMAIRSFGSEVIERCQICYDRDKLVPAKRSWRRCSLTHRSRLP